jgi:hypothetical protein
MQIVTGRECVILHELGWPKALLKAKCKGYTTTGRGRLEINPTEILN